MRLMKVKDLNSILIYMAYQKYIFTLLIICFGIGSVKAQSVLSLKKVLPFPIGAAVNVKYLKNNASYRNLLLQQFNCITTENEMKFKAIHPSEGVYRWDDADYLVNFAIKNKLRIHGHTLVWHGSLPVWVHKFQGDSVKWERLIKNHIQTIVSRYKGRVKSWDVVNEAFDDNGTFKKTIWFKKLGANYIERAFIYAHEADPNALLFMNDNANEASPAKRNAILKLVNKLKAKGIPINGLGMQMHTRLAQPNSGIVTALKTAAATGLMVHLSELDIRIRPYIYSDSTIIMQALKYKFIVNQYNVLIPKSQQFGITTWNITDKDSWLNKSASKRDWPLLFDDNYKPKRAFKAIVESF